MPGPVGLELPELYFEDFRRDQLFELGSRTVSEEELIAYAREWDLQPFHVDPVAAKDSVYGGLIASGGQPHPRGRPIAARCARARSW